MRPEHRSSLSAALLLLTLLTACTLQIGWENQPAPNTWLTATFESLSTDNAALIRMLSTLQVEPADTPRPTETIQSFLPATPTPEPPVFRNIHYSVNPDGEPAQVFFPAGTEQIYAFWDYANLQDGMMIRRVWSQEGRLLFVREEIWDTNRYGSTGTMSGISIINEEIGFPSGRYSLTLFINGAEQVEISQSQRTFWLVDPRVESPVTSPDRSQRVHIQAAGRLFLEETGGELRLLSVFQEISHLDWFPDSRFLLVGERDRTLQTAFADDTGIAHKLWVLEAETGERHLIGGAGENFHSPSLSPGGEYIAVLAGPTIQESCRASPIMILLNLDQEHHRQSVFQIHDFAGLANEEPPRYGIFPRVSKDTFSWIDPNLLEVELWWSCPPPDQPLSDGLYQFNLSDMSVEKK
jgi:hypothetical protein